MPLWVEIVEEMSRTSNVSFGKRAYPAQLEECLKAIGRGPFQRTLRQRIHEELARSLIDQAQLANRTNAVVPEPLRQIAHLGSLANPIVNFNIESATSKALAGPGGPWAVKYCVTPVPGAVHGISVSTGKFQGQRFHRHALHPHGVITQSGICVLTRSEYERMSGSLAFELAAHAAFGSRLVIVGMSLNDGYLLDHLASFRRQIRDVFWFTDEQSEGTEARTWAAKNDVRCVVVPSWPAFWASVQERLPGPDEYELTQNWWNMVGDAFWELGASPMTDYIRSLGANAPQALIDFREQIGEDPGRAARTSEDYNREDDIMRPILEAFRKLAPE